MAEENAGVPPVVPQKPSCCSKFTFSFLTPLIRKIERSSLSIDDIPALPKQYSLIKLLEQFNGLQGPSRTEKATAFELAKVLFRMNKKMFVFTAGLACFYMAMQVTSPLMIKGLIESLENDTNDGLYYTFGLFGCLVLASIANQHNQNHLYHIGNRQRALLSALIYRRAVGRSADSYLQDGVSFGAVVNLLSNDAQKLFDVMPTIHLVWTAPLQIFVASYLLIQLLGLPALAGIACLTVLAPVNFYLSKAINNMRKQHMPITDERVNLCSEVFSGIQIVKCFSWEKKFFDKIVGLRKVELGFVRNEMLAFANFVVLLIAFPSFSLMCTFLTFVYVSEKPLNAADAFSTIALFNALRFPLMELGQIMSTVVQCYTALNRISKFLHTATRDGCKASFNSPDDPTVKLESRESVVFQWAKTGKAAVAGEPPEDSSSFSLTIPFPLKFKSKDLVAVVGMVGSGKTLFVNSILNETYLVPPRVSDDFCNERFKVTSGKKAFVPQVAWVLNDTLQNNIIFHNRFNETIYKRVVEACQLMVDINAMQPDGDQTVIGERGVTLSGGQKQRTSLARACYATLINEGRDAPIELVLLDDPLSALDSHTGKDIFNDVLGPKGILQNVCRVLVTHNASVLSECAFVYETKNGVLVDLTQESATQRSESLSFGDGEPKAEPEAGTAVGPVKRKAGQDLMTIELKGKRGALNIQVFYDFIKLGGGWTWVIPLAFLFISERLCYGGTDWWLSVWVSAERSSPSNAPPGMTLPDASVSLANSKWYSHMHILFTFSMIVFVVGRLNCFALLVVNASGKTFENLLKGVLETDLNFFETTPLGRITNRFNFDTEVTDSLLFQRLNGSVASTMWLLTGTVIMAAVSPLILLVLLPITILYFKLHRLYRRSCVELQRMDSSTRSPIQASFFESLVGLSSIRSYHVESVFTEKVRKVIETNASVVRVQMTANRWLGLRLEFLGAHMALFSGLICWASRSHLSPGLAGLMIFWSVQFTISLTFNIINTTEAEAKLSSVERMFEYSQLPPEAPESDAAPSQIIAPNDKRGKTGHLKFDNVFYKYRDNLKFVLKGISFEIPAGQKVGVCGRTGAGKSTLANALFRFRNVSGDGKIYIDGRDIGTLPLDRLRGKICSCIPQNPVLFSGTLRFNLDPFQEYEDAMIWQCLETVQLDSLVQRLFKQQTVESTGKDTSALELQIYDGGLNLSVGQRQLVCFARTMLSKPDILLLDEATSSCDGATDEVIQTALRKEFDCTMLIIAHRLQTIMDVDKILVLDDGKCVEFGTPEELLKDKDSFFSQLVQSSESISNDD